MQPKAIPQKDLEGGFDVVVIGGGMAGVVAAIAAARLGSSVALVQDRPVLGGNSSNEIRVAIGGAEAKGVNRNAIETGILLELRLEERYCAPVPWANWGDNGYPRPHWDWVLWEKVNAEPNLTLYLNARARKAIMRDSSTLAAITMDQSSTERTFNLGAKVFIDCSGDGLIAADAGAEYRMGREGRSEYGEDLALEEGDDWVNSPSLLFSARDVGHSVPFVAPYWARDYSSRADLPNISINRVDCGYWWIEYGGTRDQFAEAEEIRDELIRVVYGVWDHIKNHGEYGAENYALDWVGAVLARRESRRFLGDHILIQSDLDSQRLFPDRIAHGGWPIDCHPPNALEARPHPPVAFWPLHAPDGAQIPVRKYPWGFGVKVSRPMRADGEAEYAAPLRGLYSIPLRSLYSRNIHNLMFAGRNISTSHVAFGSTRVQGTTGVLGQAAGTAAHFCAKYDTTPRGIHQGHLKELQQQLLKDDCYIIDLANQDERDLARRARVSASSEAGLAVLEPETYLALDVARAQAFACDGEAIGSIWLYLRSEADGPTEVSAELLRGKRLDDLQSRDIVAQASATVPAQSSTWVEFTFDASIDPEWPHRIWLGRVPGVSWGFSEDDLLGTQRAEWVEETGVMERMHGTYCFRVTPALRPYAANNVISGVSRAEKKANLWMSDTELGFPQWLRLDFEREETTDSVHLTFDTNLDRMVVKGPAPECVRDYRLQHRVGGDWIDLLQVTGNYQRHRVHRFDPVRTSGLRLLVEATNGAPQARVYEVRVYQEWDS